MRFICESCQAQYMISDEKLGPKGARVKCKKCGHVILVRKAELAQAEAPSAGGAPAGTPAATADGAAAAAPAGEAGPVASRAAAEAPTAGGEAKKHLSAAQILDGVADEEIGAVFDQALTESEAPSPDEGAPPPQAAPVANEEPAPSTFSNVPASVAPPPVYDWFVAINDQQVGPITQDKVKQLWDSGEIGPDSLCWRAGLADWKPLSEVGELSTMLVPRPTKPVIIAPAAPATPAAPVESVFATSPKAERKEAPTTGAVAPAPDSGGWRPSAATALASLLQEEMKVLNTPAPMPAAIPQPAQPARPITASSPLMQAPAFDAPMGAVPVPRFGGYAEPRSKKGLLVAGVAGGLVVAAAVAITLYLSRPVSSPPPAQVANAPKPSGPEAPKAVVPATPSPAPSPPAATAVAKPVDQKTEATVATRTEPPAPPPYEGERSGSRRDRGRHRSRSSSEQGSGPGKPENGEKVARAVEAPRDASDDEFQKEFGGGGERAASKSEKKSVYVPPAPGSASADLPDSLGQSDVMSVVVQNKPSILGCVAEQRKRDSNLSGRMVMRWQIHPNGKTSNVSVQTDEFKGTPLAGCIAGLIKTWTFPRHKIQGEPINFPFTF